MSNKLPPHNAEAEKAVLGAMVLSQSAIYQVAEFIRADDFFLEKHKLIFDTILQLNGQGVKCDPVTLDEELTRKSPDCIWIEYITEILSHTPDEDGAVGYAHIVLDKSTRRRMVQAAKKLDSLAQDESGDIEQQLGESESVVFGIRGNRDTGNHVKPSDYIMDYLKEFERLCDNEGEIAGLPTGFIDLDRLLNGLQRPNHYVLAGRPGMGKSAAAVNIAEHISSKGYKVLFFSLEMTHKQMMDRRVAHFTRINSRMIETPWRLNEHQKQEVYRAMGELEKRPFFIDTTPGLTPSKLRAKAMRLHAQHGLDLIVVDHLHLMKPDASRSRKDLEIDDNIRSLTALYKMLGIPGITLSQLSRSVESRQDKRPGLADLRESGAIEEEAYVAMFLYRDEYYNADTTERPNLGEVIIAKNRGGPTGGIDLYWNGSTVSYSNLQRQEINL